MIAGRRLRAPRQDGAVLAEPPLEEARRIVAAVAPFPDRPIAGRSLAELRRLAFQTTMQAARDYLSEAGQSLPPNPSIRILAAGHQPEIFHPGVWVKNFALHGLARAAGLVPLNLVVDNDSVKSTALTVPAWPPDSDGDPASYRLEKIGFDDWPGEVPYEECAVHDEALFATLPARARSLTHTWGFTPLLDDYWAEVMRHRERTTLLGERLVAGRRALERRWGCHNLEVPVSRLCATEPFLWFLNHLFAAADRFHAIYNDAVHDYRRVHGLRSRNHPVPDLETDGDWRELPLWGWKTGARRRGRLFVRPGADRFDVRIDGTPWPSLPTSGPGFVEAWRSLAAEGFKLRTRALMTTLYARLFVADTFIHGIGGGKYDELTDELLRRFFQIEPPPFLVLSATLLLPLNGFAATPEQARQLRNRLRDLHWNPQRHLAPGSPGAALAHSREEMVARDPAQPPTGRQRHLTLRQMTGDLAPFVVDRKRQTEAALAATNAELHANAILRRRDFGFCWYPAALLQPFCQQFLGGD